MWKYVLSVLAALLFALPGPLRADAKEEWRGWRLAGSISGQINPLGLSLDKRLFYSLPLFPENHGPLWDSSRVEAGLHNALTPAFDTLSAFVRIAPLAVFDLSASTGLRAYHDFLGFGYTPRDSYRADWSPAARKNTDRFAAWAWRHNVTASLKGMAGPFAFLTAASVTVYDVFSAPDGADYYYDPSTDTIFKRFDGFVSSDSAILYACTKYLWAGLIHSFLYVPGSHYSSRRLALLLRLEGDISPALTAAAALAAGAATRDRYYSYRAGKLYAAFHINLTMKL